MAVTSWKTPGTAANVNRNGNYWDTPNDAKVSDNNHALCALSKSSYGDWLRLTNFGFSTSDIPSVSTIDGIEVKIERKEVSGGVVKDSALYLRKTSDSSPPSGDNKASATYYTTSDVEVTYGGATDTWNKGLVDTDIVSSDFGIDLSCYNADANYILPAYVDCISIRVYYSAGKPHSWGVIIG
jgi:hypothetical protein